MKPIQHLFALCLLMALAVLPYPASALTSVYLEELTSPEIKAAVADGATTVLIPTGGTEQNGPHMVLGKHNYIVRHTAGEIAARLGDTLVAPVVAYTPEGNIDPPQGHMRFAGTVSIPEATFEATLEAIARSLKQHDFKYICFVGDSGPNQPSQAKIAEKLTEEWKKERIKVLHVGNYYAANSQQEWLIERGESLETIGTHAGIADTSELMSVYSRGVRTTQRRQHTRAEMETTGADGDATRASATTGARLLALKIDAAVKQIRAVQQP